MKDGVGPAAWAIRPELPDLTHDGEPKIVPMRVATDFSVETRDPDPRGRPVYGVDGQVGATVTGYLGRPQRAADPLPRARRGRQPGDDSHELHAGKRNGDVHVKSVCGKHFADAPSTANPDQITLQEEDKIGAYYAGGYLYAVADRTEPLL
jgi:photosynthetic reaction center H subunit